MNHILTVCFGPLSAHETFHIFLKSWHNNAKKNNRLIIFTDGMAPIGLEWCKNYGAEVCEVNSCLTTQGDKRRQWIYAKWCAENQDAKMVMTVDSRDSVFVADPFDFKFSPKKIHVTAEAVTFEDCPWNVSDMIACMNGLTCEQREFSQKWQVINGGFIAGYPEHVSFFSMARYAFDARTKGGHWDQSSLALLTHWSKDWGLIRIVGAEEPWIGHGHHYDKWPQPQPDYRILHQWDRTQMPIQTRQSIVTKYGVSE